MQNPRLATRYAKSLLDLAVERNSVEATLSDMQALSSICSQSHEFEVVLRSPVISGEKKLAVVKAVLRDHKLNEITNAFMSLLVQKGREMFLPDISHAFIAQYKTMKNIRTVKLTTAAPMADAVRDGIVSKISSYMPGNNTIDLETVVDESLIGGFVMEVEDRLYDASVRKSLNDVRASITDNSYKSKM